MRFMDTDKSNKMIHSHFVIRLFTHDYILIKLLRLEMTFHSNICDDYFFNK